MLQTHSRMTPKRGLRRAKYTTTMSLIYPHFLALLTAFLLLSARSYLPQVLKIFRKLSLYPHENIRQEVAKGYERPSQPSPSPLLFSQFLMRGGVFGDIQAARALLSATFRF